MNTPSPFLAALPDLIGQIGQCALHFLWQGTALAAGLAILLVVCRRGTAELRSALCGVTLLLMALAPAVTWLRLPVDRPGQAHSALMQAEQAFLQGTTEVPDAGNVDAAEHEGTSPALPAAQGNQHADSPASAATSATATTATALPPPVVPRAEWRWQRIAGWLWLAGAGLMLLWRGCSLWITLRMIQRAQRIAGPLADVVARMAERCGLRLAPVVKLTAQLASPAVAGVVRPVLLIPAAALAGLSPRELEFILAHEFAHIRRQDFLIGLLQSAVETILFFHPAVWWVSRRLNAEREHACDDAAARITGDRRAGATALARLAELQLAITPALLPGATGGPLLTRIQRLLQPGKRTGSGVPMLLFPLLSLLACLPLLLVQKAESQEPAPTPSAEALAATPQEPAPDTIPIPLMRGTITDRNGVVLAESTPGTRVRNGKHYAGERRRYPLGATASHVLGYIRQGDGETEPDKGVSGIEQVADDVLRSVPTVTSKELPEDPVKTPDAQIQWIAEEALRGSVPGDRGAAVVMDPDTGEILAMAPPSLRQVVKARPPQVKAQTALALTLDARIQRIAEDALRTGGVGRGSAVVVDPHTGDILAMASVPDFDPNDFVPFLRKDVWEKSQSDFTLPLLNRAMNSFAPGSTFKIITALAGVDMGIDSRTYNCAGEVQYGNRMFPCWTKQKALPGHGTLDLPEAMQRSCNCWFYQAGNDIGIERIAAMAEKFGIGRASGMGLDGNTPSLGRHGFMPTPEWWADAPGGGKWSPAKTANVSIGQGEVLATPLHLARLAAAIANGGKIWQTRIISGALAEGTWTQSPPRLEHDLVQEGVSPATIAALREGMIRVVNAESGGTARRAQSWFRIAGKTGTAQMKRTVYDAETGKPKDAVRDNHAQFMAFAPYDNPRYAVSVVIANGEAGGAVAAPIARRILESIELMNLGLIKVDLKPQAVARGHFEKVNEVNYGQPLPVPDTAGAASSAPAADSQPAAKPEGR